MTIVLKSLGLEWPNGEKVFENLNLSLGKRKYGLVGPNGIGKTALARIISGNLRPTFGEVLRGHEEIYFFEQESARAQISISEYLLDTYFFEDPRLFSFLGELPLEKKCSLLSGGEWMRVRLAKAAASKSSFIVFDEPTNHLDGNGRKVVYDFLRFFNGGLLIISHDRELLERVDKIIELSEQGLSIISGGWSAYEDFRTNERQRLQKNLEEAKKNRKKANHKRQEEVEKQVKRASQGKKSAPKRGEPRMLMGAKKRKAEKTTGRVDKETMEKIDESVSLADLAYKKVKVDPLMFVDLPKVNLPQSKLVLELKDFNVQFQDGINLWKKNIDLTFKGPMKVGLEGENGSGKSTLMKLALDEKGPGNVKGLVKMGDVVARLLDQDHSALNVKENVFENIRSTSNLSDQKLRNLLASFLFTGDDIFREVTTLSGGEKLRASLAKVLLASPPANVLMLDEPTNNLDIVNIEFLERLLSNFEGALFIASHDSVFLEGLSLDYRLRLES